MQETPKYSTDMFSSARSSMDQKDFADGLQSEDDILAELMGQGCDSPQDRQVSWKQYAKSPPPPHPPDPALFLKCAVNKTI